MNMNDKCCKSLSKLLAFMRAMQDCYQSAHWQAKGPVGYQDHLLFERLYGAMGKEVDTLAEKVVGMCGDSYVGCTFQARLISKYSQRINPTPHAAKRMLAAEKALQLILKKTYDVLDTNDCLSLGMDDFLMATASAHETAVYLLQQRLKG